MSTNTIRGTQGNDTLYSTFLDDSILGANGNDTFYLSPGNDVLDGGNGNDIFEISLREVPGTTTLLGGAGDDTFNFSNAPRLYADGGDGDDLFNLGISNLYLGANSTLTGGNGVDTYNFGVVDRDRAYTVTDFTAGPGGDKITLGWRLTNEIRGVSSSNFFVNGPLRLTQSGADTLLEIQIGIKAYTTLLILQNVDKNSLTVDNFTQGFSPDGHNAGKKLVAGATGSALDGFFFDDTLIGGNGNDTLDGNFGNDQLQGGAGNDVLVGGPGDDTLDGGAGDDRLINGNYNYGQSGSDVLLGGAGNDTLIAFQSTGGTVEHVTLDGGEGDDTFDITLDNARGEAHVTGGGGRDTYLIAHLDTYGSGLPIIDKSYHISDFAAGAGGDRLDLTDLMKNLWYYAGGNPFYADGGFQAVQVGDNVELRIRERVFVVLDNVQASSLTADNFVNQLDPHGGPVPGKVLTAGAGNVEVAGGYFNDTINGGTGANTLRGGGGDDMLRSATKTNLLNGDYLDGESGNDTLIGSNANDRLYDSAGNNYMAGGTGDDTLISGIGNDTLDGGAGSDSLNGGYGDDVFQGFTGKGNDTVDGSSGKDTIKLDGNFADYKYSLYWADIILTAASGSTITVREVEQFEFKNGSLSRDEMIHHIPTMLDDLLNGFSGNDTLDGGAGDDTMAGGLGNDTYLVESIGDTVIEAADEGKDQVKVGLTSPGQTYVLADNVEDASITSALETNVTGNSGHNMLTGNAEANVLLGGDGNDTLFGMAGNDRLEGGSGNDTLDGGAGNDTMLGGAGDDTYVLDGLGDKVIDEQSDSGKDLVKVAYNVANQTYMLADNVEDAYITSAIATNVTGNSGDNTLTGNAVANVLKGDDGNDTLTGLAGGDRLEGGSGNDVLDGGTGNDTMLGGAGDDVYRVDAVGDSVTEAFGEGSDKVDTTLASYTLGQNMEKLTALGTAAFTGVGNELDNWITSGNGNDKLTGNDGSDILDGGKGNDLLLGGTGNDVLIAGDDGKDTLDGGADTDMAVLSGQAGDWVVSRPNAIDTVLTKGANVVTLRGVEGVTFASTMQYKSIGELQFGLISSGDDHFLGTSGNELMDGKSGADTMAGLGGDDTYIVDNAGDVVIEAEDAGTDLVKVGIATAGQAYAMSANVENVLLTNSVAFNVIGNDQGNTITGNGGANSLTGGAGNDTLDGAGGNDRLEGGTGDDSLVGGAGTDTMLGGEGNDIYGVDASTDVVTEAAGQGTDTVRASAAAYTLGANIEHLVYTGTAAFSGTGNDGANRISGGNGADKLNGGLGDDTLAGGLGNDTIDGGGGIDVVELAGNSNEWVVSRATLEDTVLTKGSTKVTLRNVEAVAFGDTTKLLTDLHTNVVSAFNDVLTGNGSDNVIDGKAGADVMTGLAGNDTYVVDNTGDVVVEASGEGADLVKIAYTVAGLTYTLADNVENAQVTATIVTNVTGNALDNTITGNGAANILSGGDGNDSLDGGAGNDTLLGGAGNDTLTGGAGSDSMSGGQGDDTYTVDVAGDSVTELDGQGTDSVQSSLTAYKLGDFVENLRYTGSAAFTGTGNSLDNRIQGGNGADKLLGDAGNDTLVGGAGNDTLTGGAGTDTFVFNLSSLDTVNDFMSGTDRLQIESAQISQLGNGNGQIDVSTTINKPGGFANSNELVIVTTDLATLSASTAALAIGSATGAYTAGQKVLFVVDNGVTTQVCLFTSSGADALVSAAELKPIATLVGTPATVLADFDITV